MNSYILHQEAMEPKKKKLKIKPAENIKCSHETPFAFALSLFISSYTMLNKIKRF